MSLNFSATLCSLCISANFPNDAGKLSLAGGIRLAAFSFVGRSYNNEGKLKEKYQSHDRAMGNAIISLRSMRPKQRGLQAGGF